MGNEKIGQIVWHDFFTCERPRAMSFYRAIAGWDYMTEHATDFAWGEGAQDYVLAVSGTEAGAGFIETSADMTSGWIAYVEVGDVDLTADQAERLGGGVVRAPFDVPGVGRNALLRDPHGAVIGIALSRHSFPVPNRQFGAELYASAEGSFPQNFYGSLFGWAVSETQENNSGDQVIFSTNGAQVATLHSEPLLAGQSSRWVPGIKVADPADAAKTAEKLGGVSATPLFAGSSRSNRVIVQDTDGTLIHMMEKQGA